MKKIISIILSLLLVIACSGCINSITPVSPEIGKIVDNTNNVEKSAPNDAPPKVKTDPTAKTINLNETITVGNMMEITIESCEWADQITPKNTDSYYSYIGDQEGEKFFVAKGKIKNLAGSNLQFSKSVEGSLVVNDTYSSSEISCQAENADGRSFGYDIKPLQTLNVIIYASLSDELQSISKKVDLTLKLANNATYVDKALYSSSDNVPYDIYTISFEN